MTPLNGPILFLVFDEMDGPLLWTNLDRLPNLRLLSESSFMATKAKSPADWTLQSIPSYTIGSVVTSSRPHDKGRDLALTTIPGSAPISWAGHPANLFRLARDRGLRPSVAGFFHPYCDVFAGILTNCHSEQGDAMGELARWAVGTSRQSFIKSVPDAMLVPFRQLLTLQRFDGVRFPTHEWMAMQLAAANSADKTQAILNATLQSISSGRSSFVFAHFPIPHLPAIRPGSTYSDNYYEADHVVGELVGALKAGGLFENSTIIVTSDHSLRPFWLKSIALDATAEHVLTGQDTRAVPLIVKLPRMSRAYVHSEVCSTLSVYDLSVSAINGRLTQVNDIRRSLALSENLTKAAF
jgi:hypothetical protein